MRRKPKIKEAVGAEPAAGDETFNATVIISDAQRPSRKISTVYSFSRRSKPTTIIPYLRVSRKYHNWKACIQQQLKAIRAKARKYNHDVTLPYIEVQRRWRYERKDRPQLAKAVRLAKMMGWPICVVDVTRLCGYKTTQEPPAQSRLRKFSSIYPNVQFLVVAAAATLRSKRTKRGHKNIGYNAGGDRKPGWKKRRRELFLPLAHKYRKAGLSWREIERKIGGKCTGENYPPVRFSTIQEWCRNL